MCSLFVCQLLGVQRTRSNRSWMARFVSSDVKHQIFLACLRKRVNAGSVIPWFQKLNAVTAFSEVLNQRQRLERTCRWRAPQNSKQRLWLAFVYEFSLSSDGKSESCVISMKYFWIGSSKHTIKYADSFRRRVTARNVSFRISLRNVSCSSFHIFICITISTQLIKLNYLLILSTDAALQFLWKLPSLYN